MKQKMIFAICLTAFLASGIYANTYASEATKLYNSRDIASNAEINPNWVNVAVISADLAITNGRANMAGRVVGNVGTQSITVNATLERANPNGTFTHIASWNNLRSNNSIWTWDRNHYVARGHDYRLTLTATVVRNGISEVVSESMTARAH